MSFNPKRCPTTYENIDTQTCIGHLGLRRSGGAGEATGHHVST